jgi:hypothetical protein
VHTYHSLTLSKNLLTQPIVIPWHPSIVCLILKISKVPTIVIPIHNGDKLKLHIKTKYKDKKNRICINRIIVDNTSPTVSADA